MPAPSLLKWLGALALLVAMGVVTVLLTGRPRHAPPPAMASTCSTPNVIDSDGDTLGDCTEAVDTDGNGIIDFGGDAINSARATLLPAGTGPGKFGKDGDFDLNGNNVLAGDYGADTITTAKMAFKILVCK
jgi:hypothetical protein